MTQALQTTQTGAVLTITPNRPDIRTSSEGREGREGVQSFLQKRKPFWLA
ncbi:MAG: hypothetical protein I8H91_08285 [Burkholderiales bacterium]|nr:hypothetical protein [Burkholderiales bacterium]